MRKLVFICMYLSLAIPCAAGTIYVSASAAGANTGSSWTDAYIDLQNALDDPNLAPGDDIRVAEGTYKPSYDYGLAIGDRGNHFRMINGVAIFGGFPTGGSDFANRDPNQYETILSGDIGTPDDPNDNCYHVFYHPSLSFDPNTILDGFTITAGNADGANPYNHGGGMFNLNSSPTVTDCTFTGNSADGRGGGVYNSDCSPTVISCTFTENSAVNGGGMANGGFESSAVTGCIFTNNSADNGGGMYNATLSSQAVTDCIFTDNSAGEGGGMYNSYSYMGMIVTGCTFTGNSADGDGGGMNNYRSYTTVTSCTFTGNSAEYDGGGMYNLESNPTVTGCTFSGNSAVNGGGMYNDDDDINQTVKNCTFTGNSAQYGGGMYNYRNYVTVTGCTFTGNTADLDGGGMYNSYSYMGMIVTGCTFTGNSADGDGGGISNYKSSPTVTGCIFTANSANTGGGMRNWDLFMPTVTRGSTFTGNSAVKGGGICNLFGSSTVINCILWDNTASLGGNDIALFESSIIDIDYCDVQGGLSGIYDDGAGSTIIWGAGNIDTDPYFVDPGYWDENSSPADPNDNFWVDGDYHLKSEGWSWDNDANQWTWDDVTSPCIDAGNPGALLANEPMALEVDPLNRWGENIRINMGAYGGSAEASMPPYDWALLADLTNDGIVNLTDFVNQSKDWQNTAVAQPGDLNRNGTVEINDALLMAYEWLKTTSWY